MGLAFISREELKKILELPIVLFLKETLGAASLTGVPAELWPPTHIVGLFAIDQGVPGFMNERLVQKTIDDTRMHPVTFSQARLEMAGNMFDVTLSGRMQSRTEATSPVLALTEELYHLFSVGASRTAVALLVVLIERIGAPETPIAARLWAWVLPPTLMEFILVAFPVVLALEASLTRGAPVDVSFAGGGCLGTVDQRCTSG